MRRNKRVLHSPKENSFVEFKLYVYNNGYNNGPFVFVYLGNTKTVCLLRMSFFNFIMASPQLISWMRKERNLVGLVGFMNTKPTKPTSFRAG